MTESRPFVTEKRGVLQPIILPLLASLLRGTLNEMEPNIATALKTSPVRIANRSHNRRSTFSYEIAAAQPFKCSALLGRSDGLILQ